MSLKQQLRLTNSLCMCVSTSARCPVCSDPSTRFDKGKFILSHWTTPALYLTQTSSLYTDSGWFELLPRSLPKQSKIKFSPVTIITKDLKTNTMACIYGLFYNSVSRLLHTTRGDALLTTWRHGWWAQIHSYCYQVWTSALDTREWSRPRPGRFTPGKNLDTHRLEGWVSPKVCQDGCGKDKNFLSYRLQTPNLSAYKPNTPSRHPSDYRATNFRMAVDFNIRAYLEGSDPELSKALTWHSCRLRKHKSGPSQDNGWGGSHTPNRSQKPEANLPMRGYCHLHKYHAY